MSSNESMYNNILQNIIVDKQGVILQCENTLFEVNQGDKIQDFHPIFTQLFDKIDDDYTQVTTYSGVYISINDEHVYCDITIKNELQFMAITMFNSTNRYDNSQRKMQQRNKSIIESSSEQHFDHQSFKIND